LVQICCDLKIELNITNRQMSKQRKSGERGIGFYTAIREVSGKQQREYASILLHSAASESEPGNEHSFVNKEQTDDIFFDCEDENNLEGMECVDEEEDEVFDDDVENDDDDRRRGRWS